MISELWEIGGVFNGSGVHPGEEYPEDLWLLFLESNGCISSASPSFVACCSEEYRVEQEHAGWHNYLILVSADNDLDKSAQVLPIIGQSATSSAERGIKINYHTNL